MREIYIKSKAGLLPIGRRGENLATRVHLAEVPAEGQAVTVYVMRNGDTVAYPASQVEITDTEIVWTVTSVDTGKSGRGKVQYRFSDSVTGEVIKTEIYGFLVGLAIDTEVGPAPDPYETWLDSLTDLAGQAQVAARDAEADATRAETYAEQAEASAGAAAESAEEASQSEQEARGYLDTITEQVMPAFEQIAQRTTNSADAASNSATQAQVATERAVTAQTEAESSARQASASAESASASKTAAETARREAYEWAQSSQTYSGQSQGYASQAATSATSAGQSATAASASATSASQSAQTATAKASEASASATTATTKASEASASATAAQTARTGAETAQAASESAAQTAQAGADAVGLLREQIYNSYPNVEAEAGPIVSITDGADGIPVKSLVVGIEPVQAGSGDPSPDNVRPISGWTGCEVVRTGKNLLDVDRYGNTLPKTAAGITWSKVRDGVYHVQGTATGNSFFNISFTSPSPQDAMPCDSFAGKRLFLSFTDTQIVVGLSYFKEDGTFSQMSNGSVLPDDAVGLRAYVKVETGIVIDTDFSIQLELGSTATAYEPYQGETYSVTFPSEAGTVYGGSLDVTSGVLTVDRAMIASYAGEVLSGEWISDRDVYAEGVTPTTGAQVVYELATPITYQLTPVEVKTLLGSNSIWADTGDTSLAYRADPKLYIDEVFEDYQDDLADYADAIAALG